MAVYCMFVRTSIPVYSFIDVWLTGPVCKVLLVVNRAHFYTWLTPSLDCLCLSGIGLVVSITQSPLYTGRCTPGKGLLCFIRMRGGTDVDLCVFVCAEERTRECTQTMQTNAFTMYRKISLERYQLNASQWKNNCVSSHVCNCVGVDMCPLACVMECTL